MLSNDRFIIISPLGPRDPKSLARSFNVREVMPSFSRENIPSLPVGRIPVNALQSNFSGIQLDAAAL
jgi:hypothetical protein